MNIMNQKEFDELISRYEWEPANIILNIPEFLCNIPAEKLYGVYVSGENRNYHKKGDIIGGIDVIRKDIKDEARGFPFNKDHYVIIKSENSNLIIKGPLKDDEHWINDIPARLKNAKIYEVNI
jgi:hypothetical protein